MSVPGTRTRVRRPLGRREDEEQQDVSCPALGTSLVVGLAAEDPPAGSVLGMETTSPPPGSPRIDGAVKASGWPGAGSVAGEDLWRNLPR